MLEYDFMRTAFVASGMAAVLAGTVGFFLVLRGQTFAGHALSHVGFTGATGAVLFGLSPLAGLGRLHLRQRDRHGTVRREARRARRRDRHDAVAGARLRALVPAFLHHRRRRRPRRCLFGNVLGVDEFGAHDVGLALDRQPRCAGLYRPTAHLRLAATGSCRSARRADPLRLGGVSGDCRDRGRGMRANRRRAAWCSR